ncbi:major facilitator superfamily domain-containing protein [Sporodiniella umbellata]|nr:major facilitator superfamily domain-containing protein [Sporodiniella umbellata]
MDHHCRQNKNSPLHNVHCSYSGYCSYLITLVTVTSVCFAFFGVPVGPLVDGGVLKILGRHKDQYGRQRMFGSISFGVASSLVGFITEWTNDMNSIFYVYAISAICFILVAGNTQFRSERQPYIRASSSHRIKTLSRVPERSKTIQEDQGDQSQKDAIDPYDQVGIDLNSSQIRQNEIQRLIQFATESSIIEAVNLANPPTHRIQTFEPSNMLDLLKRSEVSLFYLTMMLMGASLNMVMSFLFIYLKQEMGASSSQLIRLFGIKSLVILGHVLTIVRIFMYTVLPRSPTGASVAIGLHLLNGIAFSALWGAGVVQADELAPPSLQATSQGIYIY